MPARAEPPSRAPRIVYSAYKDLAMSRNPVSQVIMTTRNGAPVPYIAQDGGRGKAGPGRALTWAFATGECGNETWAGQDAQQVATANVGQFDQAGVDYIVSTGGEGGVFTCGSDAGMERFIARYASPHFIGIDFDIEAGQSAAQVESLVAHIKAAQQKHPGLRFSFTVATFGASDGSMRSLNAQGEAILAAVRRSGLREFTFNLMVMDFGPAMAANCVVRDLECDMGASAIQAAHNVNNRYGIGLDQIELTAMIGVNDVAANVFTLDDARVVADAVRNLKLAGLHFWSLDRDLPCSADSTGASASCSGLQVRSGEFARVLNAAHQ
jgi:hypothetical protein